MPVTSKPMHPRASLSTCQVEGSKCLKKPMVAKYLAAKAQLVTEKTNMNAARVLEESVEMLEMAKGKQPQVHEFMVSKENEEGTKEYTKIRNELCNTNLAMMGKALELIGRNVAVRAFEDSVAINHTHDLERMLNDRGKELEEGARKRMERLALVTTDE